MRVITKRYEFHQKLDRLLALHYPDTSIQLTIEKKSIVMLYLFGRHKRFSNQNSKLKFYITRVERRQ